jgi:hypothetical protein
MSDEKWIVEHLPSRRRVRHQELIDRVIYSNSKPCCLLGIYNVGKKGRLVAIVISNSPSTSTSTSDFTLRTIEHGASLTKVLKLLQKRKGGKELTVDVDLLFEFDQDEMELFGKTFISPTPLFPCYAHPLAKTLHVLTALSEDEEEPQGELMVDMAVKAMLADRADPMTIPSQISRMRIWRKSDETLDIRFWPPIAMVSCNVDNTDRALSVWSMSDVWTGPLMDGVERSLNRPRIIKTCHYGEAMGWRSTYMRNDMYADYVSRYIVKPKAKWKREKIDNQCMYEREAKTLMTLVNAPEKQRRSIASLKIQRAWRQAVENPEYSLCRRRLLREFETLSHESIL